MTPIKLDARQLLGFDHTTVVGAKIGKTKGGAKIGRPKKHSAKIGLLKKPHSAKIGASKTRAK